MEYAADEESYFCTTYKNLYQYYKSNEYIKCSKWWWHTLYTSECVLSLYDKTITTIVICIVIDIVTCAAHLKQYKLPWQYMKTLY